ncbi:NifU family protein [Actinophytocola oryzae]|uniref:NifU-like protein n=1 Tax=Actinophytocola oryzae TaxID=502181 RepID=A0A4R7W2J2_9PSEU|nr:NifU family protein [Actinophytocola oryzae]TDV56345.1 NifU-like protein [Actinophytocola oryzae]
MQQAVETALANLRPALAADGFDLRIGSIEADNSVRVILEAKPDACMDCLVPDPVLHAILDKAIHDQDPNVGTITVDKVGFENVEAH